MRARLVLAAAVAAATIGTLALAPLSAGAAVQKSATIGIEYPGDPIKEAAIVAAEDQRIYNVRAVTAAARWQGLEVRTPYRLVTGASTTLVLVARNAAYGIAELQELEPDRLVKQPDGSYLLSENIIIESGATVKLASPDGLVLHLASTPKGFVSIIAQGGALQLAGSAKAPVTIDSWDASVGKVDNDTADGRAYVRIIGGSASFSYATFDHLGFWSGATGGLALTGTDITDSPVPSIGSVKGSEILPTAPSVAPGADPTAGTDAEAAPQGGYSYVSARLNHVTMSHNAYGVFINGAQGVSIANSTARNNLVDGIVLHRYVTNSTITTTTTTRNGMDGFAMTRASTGIVISQLVADRNGRDGVSLNGGPLASGPNATGTPTGSYGNNSLSDSTANSNARYGVTVVGGDNVKIVNNTTNHNLMGIVVTKLATGVTVKGNTVNDNTKHGIAFFDGVGKSTVVENSISGAGIGLYLRDSSADVLRNSISAVTNHGVTLSGETSGTAITDNRIGGRGTSAIDTVRGNGFQLVGNDLTRWTNTKPFWVTVRSIFQPLTVLWIILGLTVLLTAAIGSRSRNRGVIRHPYASHVPLTALSRGVVRPEDLGLEPVVHVSAEVEYHRDVHEQREPHEYAQETYAQETRSPYLVPAQGVTS